MFRHDTSGNLSFISFLCENINMFEQDLKDKYPFLTKYFENGINNSERNISHSILFYGQDISAQYELALEVARLLNCQELQNQNCNCINCNWIRQKQHPAVLTISRFDNKPSDDDSKTVISVKQSQMIKNSLLNTSDYHRVFIFCDAKMEGEVWTPSGLNEFNFQEEAANSLLKTIEEPPENTTFFFLTRDKHDVLGTILSRSQSFFVPSYNAEDRSYCTIETYLANYLNLERKESLDLALDLFSLAKEKGNEKILDEIQNYLLALLKSNLDNNLMKNKILSDIKIIETAKDKIKKHIHPQLAFEDMCLNIIK